MANYKILGSTIIAAILGAVATIGCQNGAVSPEDQAQRVKAGIPENASDDYLRMKIAQEVFIDLTGRIIWNGVLKNQYGQQESFVTLQTDEGKKYDLVIGNCLMRSPGDSEPAQAYVDEYGVSLYPQVRSSARETEFYTVDSRGDLSTKDATTFLENQLKKYAGQKIKITAFMPSQLKFQTAATKAAYPRVLGVDLVQP